MNSCTLLSLLSVASVLMGAIVTPAIADDQAVVLKFSAAKLAIPILASLALVALFWLSPLLRIPSSYRWRILVVGGIVAIVVAPNMYADRIILTPTAISNKTGFWFKQTDRGFPFDDIANIHVTSKRGFPIPRSKMIWEIEYRHGETNVYDPSDLWANKSDEIVAYMKKHGVRFTD